MTNPTPDPVQLDYGQTYTVAGTPWEVNMGDTHYSGATPTVVVKAPDKPADQAKPWILTDGAAQVKRMQTKAKVVADGDPRQVTLDAWESLIDVALKPVDLPPQPLPAPHDILVGQSTPKGVAVHEQELSDVYGKPVKLEANHRYFQWGQWGAIQAMLADDAKNGRVSCFNLKPPGGGVAGMLPEKIDAPGLAALAAAIINSGQSPTKVFVIFYHEPEDDYERNTNPLYSLAKYVLAWRYFAIELRKRFTGVPPFIGQNFMAFTINSAATNKRNIDNYYAGDDVVDFVAFDGYAAPTVEAIFTKPLAWTRKLNGGKGKPFVIAEVGESDAGNQGKFIRDGDTWMRAQPDAIMSLYWDQDKYDIKPGTDGLKALAEVINR